MSVAHVVGQTGVTAAQPNRNVQLRTAVETFAVVAIYDGHDAGPDPYDIDTRHIEPGRRSMVQVVADVGYIV